MKKRRILLGVMSLVISLVGCSNSQITVNEDQQGPIFPLSFVTETEGIIAEREITVDYSDYKYPTTTNQDDNRKVKTNDKYILTNITDQDIVTEYAYGFVGDYSTNLSMLPQIRIDGTSMDSELVFGRSPLRYGVEISNREAYVYRLKSVEYEEKNKDGQLPYGRISFSFDSATTEVYSHGFDECKEKNGSVTLGFSVSKRNDRYLIAVGDKLHIQ